MCNAVWRGGNSDAGAFSAGSGLGSPEEGLSRTEEWLIERVERLLGVRGIQPMDDFFDLGGHSLTGMQLLADAAERFQVNLPLSTLLESPTIHALAERLAAPVAAGRWNPLLVLRGLGSLVPL